MSSITNAIIRKEFSVRIPGTEDQVDFLASGSVTDEVLDATIEIFRQNYWLALNASIPILQSPDGKAMIEQAKKNIEFWTNPENKVVRIQECAQILRQVSK